MRYLFFTPAALLLLAVAASPTLYGASDRIFPGVTQAGVEIGGLTADEATARLASRQAAWEGTLIKITVPSGTTSADSSVLLKRTDLGLTYPLDVEKARKIGRDGNLISNWQDAVSTLRQGREVVTAPASAKPTAQAETALKPFTAVEQRGLLEMSAENKLLIFLPAAGKYINWANVQKQALTQTELVLAPVVVPSPTNQKLYDQAKERAQAALTAHKAGYSGSAFSRELTLEERRSLFTIDWSADGPTTNFSTAAAKKLVAALAKEGDVAPLPANVEIRAGKAVFTGPDTQGIALDQVAALKLLEQKLFDPTSALSFATVKTTSAFDAQAAQRWVVKATVLGTATTDFDPAPRVVNIKQAAKQLDQKLVLSKTTFSFWDRIGEVSYARGFIDAGAIIDGVSSTALAGGICQVSTTLFGAVYRTGVPIVERHHHDYYIHHYQLGMDATVFDPGADLVWENDLPDPVLTHSYTVGNNLTFQVWGIATGRVVTLNTRDGNYHGVAPGTRPDPAFPAGYTEIGRDVVVSRTVKEPDGSSSNDQLVSSYQAVWGGP